MLRNTPTRYGAVTKTIHWVTAVLVLGQLVLGLNMNELQDQAEKLRFYGLHRSIGVGILILVLLRICWHLFSKKPPLLATLKTWEKDAARAVHCLLYMCLIAMPLSGWLMSSAVGRPVHFFRLFTLPTLIGENEDAAYVLRVVHGLLGTALMILIAVHVLAALKHFIIDRDRTLQRMLPFSGDE